jgi:hypothetical protein
LTRCSSTCLAFYGALVAVGTPKLARRRVVEHALRPAVAAQGWRGSRRSASS